MYFQELDVILYIIHVCAQVETLIHVVRNTMNLSFVNFNNGYYRNMEVILYFVMRYLLVNKSVYLFLSFFVSRYVKLLMRLYIFLNCAFSSVSVCIEFLQLILSIVRGTKEKCKNAMHLKNNLRCT